MDRDPPKPIPPFPFNNFPPQMNPMMQMPMMQQPPMQFPPPQPQQPQMMNYVQNIMRQRNIPPYYLQDPNFRQNFIQSIMPQQKPAPFYPMPPPQPMMQKKRPFDRYDDYDDEEVVDDEPSSEEAQFTDESEESPEENFSEMNDDYVTSDPGTRRTAGREHHSAQNFSDDDDTLEEEEFVEGPAQVEESKIEHIYVSRVGKDDIEYLVHFQDQKDCLSQWIPESLLMCLDNANYHLTRFKQSPVDITSAEGKDIVPIAYRKNDNVNELLYRFTFDTNTLLYWDAVDEKTLNDFKNSRHRVDVSDAPLPTGDLPEPTSSIINDSANQQLREYQLQGLQWLIKCWRDGHGSILADEMGLGKTIQVLSFLTYLNRYTDWHGPFVIAVRTNTFKQWCEEIEKWTDLSFIPYSSGPAQRKIIREFQFPFLDDNGSPIPNTFSFNILLVSYDVFLKDSEFLDQINWQVLVVDEGHRIKNSEGKKNNAMKKLNVKHRILLTGTPVQNTLQELWTLLNFISPDQFEENPEFLQGDIESLDKDTLESLRKRIHPHLLRRTLANAERTIAPKEEKIAFVSLSNVQRELIRLIQLHGMWRLNGIQIDESTVDTSHESASIQKVCCHPFLIEGAEEYYTKKFNLSRLELLTQLSTKFVWLSKVLAELKRDNHKVLIFSQKVQLLHILREFCMLSQYNNELLIGEMSDIEKSEAIDRYSKSPDSFVFLISTRAGSEGLNLTVADTAIIFDPDWNPQNDLQAQARVHRIGQTQKVDVVRLITYQTYEHEMFVRAQRKLGLWLDLLGEEGAPKEYGTENTSPLPPPPYIESTMNINPNMNLLEQLSTVVNDFSLASLPRLEKPMSEVPNYSDGTSDEAFLAKFPVVADDQITRRVKHSHSYDAFIDSARAYEIWDEFRQVGYGKWDQMAEKFTGHSPNQLERFCHSILILCFRALPPMQMVTFPFLVKRLIHDVIDFSFDMLLCSRKGKWIHAVSEEHELSIEISACKPLKDTIYDQGYDYLTTIESKLIAKTWLTFNDKSMFNFAKTAPNYTRRDREIFESIVADRSDFDPFDDRVVAFINLMKSDIIAGGRIFAAQQFDYWTQPEYQQVINMMKNFTFSFENPIDMHQKTGLVSKTTEQVIIFVTNLLNIVSKPVKKLPWPIGPSFTLFDRAPEEIKSSKGATTWTSITKKDYTEIVERSNCLRLIKQRLERLGQFPETTTWSNYHTRILFNNILKFGFDAMTSILLDKKIGLVRMLNKHDKRFVEGKLKQRIHEPGAPPDFVLTQEELMRFMRVEDCDSKFDQFKMMNYTFVPPEQHVEWNWEAAEEEESEYLPDELDMQPQMLRKIRREEDEEEGAFNPHLLSDDE
ncbi:SNF2 family N-terminal domain containing protein [Trichomonas vaginalis G3]|uniref:SNF2 family N-terminal domain containing protein n=1 Tax=Trichomonas vaginalis (strain ATCC PRA-98 / G3) TaxID=412133 RepID=A2ECH6_TRIV3|nr:helicase protein [Trichomonas vaginalis G3]EAY09671.1 SNF2 family N-terminal domain containing protein [Trichomonas vaginalis G3]KAI5528672.1 helicase protein [Trichomonas vaginalis G3]|eukprot:XP_001321894.1 SNF2 family N-terminal domain containing protein [Trichomonas vaginalis G3]